MRFRQLDKIIELVHGERIVAVRRVRADEDYLRDHFPLFRSCRGSSCWKLFSRLRAG